MAERRAHHRVTTVASWLLVAITVWLLWPVSLGGCTSLIIVNGDSMLPGLHPGDLAVARCGNPQVGDVVIYRPFEGSPVTIIHRLNGGDGDSGWTARGDNNTFDDPFNFDNTNVVGRMVLSIPKAGFFLSFLTAPLLWLTLSLAAIAAYLWPAKDEQDDQLNDGENEEEERSDNEHAVAQQTP